jgi:lauroyl/myristoyl acyltransferase
VTLPLFTMFESSRYERLWAALRAMPPPDAFRVMSDLAASDLPAYDRVAPPADQRAQLQERARTAMAGLPRIARPDAEAAAVWFGDYGPRMQLDATFVTLALSDRERLFDMVHVEGAEHLEEALDAGCGVLALPLHLGASYVVPPILAHLHPTRFVFNRVNFAELKQNAFPELDIDAFPVSDDRTFRRGLEALGAGQIFAMFPEYDPRGQKDRHVAIPFLGGTIAVPEGPALLSRAARAPLLPVHLDSVGGGRFVLRIHPVISAPTGKGEVRDLVLALWLLIEDLLLDGRLGDWEMWAEFDRMLVKATT